ncbi:MAG: hypothetical protein ACE3L7_11325 [Candidatus Pristimantibacillus sp.]
MKKIISIIVVLAVVLATLYYMYNKEKQKAASPDDIQIKATLKINKNERMIDLDYDYMLEVVIDQKKYSQHIIYPYVEGLGRFSLDPKEDEGYYIPGSIGSAGNDEQLVIQAFRDQQIFFTEKDSSSFIGFYFPEEAGVYKMRVYLEEEANFRPSDPMYMAYVHKGDKGWGLDNNWTKLIEIKSELE